MITNEAGAPDLSQLAFEAVAVRSTVPHCRERPHIKGTRPRPAIPLAAVRRQLAKNDVLALFPPKQSVSITHLQLNVPMGGRIEENAEERFDLSCSDPTWRFGDGTDRFSLTCSISSDGKSWKGAWIERRMVGRRVSWRAVVKVGSDKRCEPGPRDQARLMFRTTLITTVSLRLGTLTDIP
jgi:hypothetical protein